MPQAHIIYSSSNTFVKVNIQSVISANLSNYYLNLQNVISDIPSKISTFLQESLHGLLVLFTMLISMKSNMHA